MGSDALTLEGQQVLVAEDEVLIADDLMDELTRLGAHPIGPASTVSDAVTFVETVSFDFALIDVVLRGEVTTHLADALISRGIPSMFITENAGFVKEQHPHIPIHPKPSNLSLLACDLQKLLESNDARLSGL